MIDEELLILKAGDGSECKRWLDIWSAWPGREVFAHPEYLRLFEGDEGDACALSMQLDGAHVVYPLLLRPLSRLDWVRGDALSAIDTTTPYGYGGPFAWTEEGAPPSAMKRLSGAFWPAVDEWMRSITAVSEFVRLHLFRSELLDYPGDTLQRSTNIVRPLDRDGDALLMDYRHKVRKNIKRAQRPGLVVEFDEAGESLERFLAVYRHTMDRQGASRYYYFSRAFFRDLVNKLQGHFVFVNVSLDGQVLSSELVLCSARRLYSFLGGTLSEAFRHRPNDLLKHEAIRWGRGRGFREYVLGGGYSENDGIFKYKKSFAPSAPERPFFVGTRVRDRAMYSRLIELRRGHGPQPEWRPRADYFPAYRG